MRSASRRRRICPDARCCRQPSAAASSPRPSYFEAMSAHAQPRLGAADGRRSPIATSSSTCRLPSATTSRPTPAKRRTSPGDRAERDRTLAAALRASTPRCPASARAEDPDAAARLRALGYVVGQRAGEGALHRSRRSETLIDLDQAIHAPSSLRRTPARRGDPDLPRA